MFGEVRLLLDTPRTALVRAITAGELLRISADALDRLTATHPALAALLYRNMSRILAERLRARSLWISRAPPL
jgi:CRP-like cAMP-binding protein